MNSTLLLIVVRVVKARKIFLVHAGIRFAFKPSFLCAYDNLKRFNSKVKFDSIGAPSG